MDALILTPNGPAVDVSLVPGEGWLARMKAADELASRLDLPVHVQMPSGTIRIDLAE